MEKREANLLGGVKALEIDRQYLKERPCVPDDVEEGGDVADGHVSVVDSGGRGSGGAGKL